MRNDLSLDTEEAFIHCENDVICKVNNKFLELICYEYDDIVGKSLDG